MWTCAESNKSVSLGCSNFAQPKSLGVALYDRLELQQMIIVKEEILEVPCYVTLVNINNQLSAVTCIHKKHTEKRNHRDKSIFGR